MYYGAQAESGHHLLLMKIPCVFTLLCGLLQSGAEEVASPPLGAAVKPNLGPLPETPGAAVASGRPLPPPPGEELYESLADLKAKGATGNRDKTLPHMSDNALSFSENDFTFVKVLGRGSFAKVRGKRDRTYESEPFIA